MHIQDKLKTIIEKQNSLVCVGLDSDINKLPAQFANAETPQFNFNKTIIDSTAEFACSFKPNTAFYEARGAKGIEELKMTCDYIREKYPEHIIVLDAKRADIGNTNEGYVTFAYDYMGADMVTLHPYLGSEAMQPFLGREDKGAIILCRTSNPGSGELQDVKVDGEELYKHVAKTVTTKWNSKNNCFLVVGATYPEEMAQIRAITGDMTFLVPGIGAQGGDVEKTVKAGINSQNAGILMSASRSIIFAENPTEEARKLRDEINQYRS